MNGYIVSLGIVNDYEEIPTREIKVLANTEYEAHKSAFFKCNIKDSEIVLKITTESRVVKFDHKKGFNP